MCRVRVGGWECARLTLVMTVVANVVLFFLRRILPHSQVVGEIYDEDDSEEQADDNQTIFKVRRSIVVLLQVLCFLLGAILDFHQQHLFYSFIFIFMLQDADGKYTVRGYAELDDVCEALGVAVDPELKGETSTIGGFLCNVVRNIIAVVSISCLNPRSCRIHVRL